MEEEPKKDFWDKLGLLLRSGGGLITAITVAVLGFKPADPKGYGRLLTRGDELIAIREDSDATPEERKIPLCNGGLMALAGQHALAPLAQHGQRDANTFHGNNPHSSWFWNSIPDGVRHYETREILWRSRILG